MSSTFPPTATEDLASATDLDAFVAALERAIGAEAVTVDLDRRRAASTDWAHLSPVLRAKLPAGLADVVAYPTDAAQIATVCAIAYEHRVPVTARGQGTGNYGQGIPLRNGLVLDTSRCKQVLEVGDGWIRAQPGTSFVALEAAARKTGQEMAMLPSTVGSAIGGFICGGSGGTGSIENGFNRDGFVLALDIAGCTDDTSLHTVTGADTDPFIHAYGVSGLIAEATVQLVPRRDWTALFTSFDDVAVAQRVGMELMRLDPPPRLLSIDDPTTVQLVVDDPAIPPARTSLRAIVDTSVLTEASALITSGGGKVEDVRPNGPAYLASLSYNHITHRALRHRPHLIHLQVGGPGLVERTAEVYEVLPDTSLHFEGMKLGGELTLGAMYLCRYESVDRLYAGIEDLARLGVHGEDPHTWILQRELDGVRQAAARFDPAGLINPGKLPAV